MSIKWFWRINRIVLLGNFARNVFIFNTSGKHIATIEASGKGPGEYVLAQDICIDYDKKELVLLASVPSKLMFYNFEGKLEREYGLENENFSLNNIVVNKKQLWGKLWSRSGFLCGNCFLESGK